jgi:hypothetical protein
MNGGTCSLAISRDGRDGHDPVVNCEAKIATWQSALHQTSAKGDCVSRTGFRDPLFQQVKIQFQNGKDQAASELLTKKRRPTAWPNRVTCEANKAILVLAQDASDTGLRADRIGKQASEAKRCSSEQNHIPVFLDMAEREGFEPPIPVKVCLISSQVNSTALPPLHVCSRQLA